MGRSSGRGTVYSVDLAAAAATIMFAATAGYIWELSEVRVICDGANELQIQSTGGGLIFGPFESSTAYALSERGGGRSLVGEGLQLVLGQANKVTGEIWARRVRATTG